MNLDKEQTEYLFNEYRDKVTRYISSKIMNRADVEDLVSEVFLKVYSKLDSFDDTKASVSTWIYHITQNTVIDFFRSQRQFSEIPETLKSEEESALDGILNEEKLRDLAKALEKIDNKEKQLIIMHYYHNIKLKEIAEKLDISYVYAKVLHKKALENLRKFFTIGEN